MAARGGHMGNSASGLLLTQFNCALGNQAGHLAKAIIGFNRISGDAHVNHLFAEVIFFEFL